MTTIAFTSYPEAEKPGNIREKSVEINRFGTIWPAKLPTKLATQPSSNAMRGSIKGRAVIETFRLIS
jgi:hypothetical protein